MKIVFIGGRDIHKLGGIENYMYNLATQLVRMGHEPIVFCESDHNGKETVNGFRVIHQKGPKSPYLCKPWLGIKATLFTIRHIKDANVIHYNGGPVSVFGILARHNGFKTIMMGHGFQWQRTKYNKVQKWLNKLSERICVMLNPNQIMCSSEQTHYFLEKYNRIAPTIPTAINLPPANEAQTSTLQNKYNLKPKKFFLFLARLVQDKNPDYLIKAFKKADIKDYQLVIAGNNPADEEYVESLNTLARGCKNIIMTGAVYGADKEWLLRNAFAFCIPSTIEGLSISLLEAMGYKLPIIASDIAANREVLTEDSAFWVIPENTDSLSNALVETVNKTQNLPNMVERNYETVSGQYTWEIVTQKYIKHIETLFSK